jgi:hypothetical protein
MMRLPVAVTRSLQALWGAALVGASVSIPAVPAHAEATVFRFADTHTETFTAPLEGCLPQDLVGTFTLTETSTGLVVDTGGGVFSVRGVNEYDAHLDLPDGSYVQSGQVNRERYVFIANPPRTVYNLVGQDQRTIFAADGTPIGTLSIHAGFHVTYNDVNGNGAPDPGEIASEFDYFHLRCG